MWVICPRGLYCKGAYLNGVFCQEAFVLWGLLSGVFSRGFLPGAFDRLPLSSYLVIRHAQTIGFNDLS